MIPLDSTSVRTDTAAAKSDEAAAAPVGAENTPVAPDAAAPVNQLLERRNQVQGWLTRLDELAHESAAHIAARVRADYDGRLSTLLAELTTHKDAIRADMDRLRADLDAADARHENAVDALEEVRLRYRVGEIEEAVWEERRQVLEEEIATAAALRDAVASELQRVEELVAQIDGSDGSSRARLHEIAISRVAVSELSAAEVEGEDDVIDIAELEVAPASDEETVPEPGSALSALDYPWELPPRAAAGEEDGEDAEPGLPPADFLEELDRALSDEPAEDPAYTLTEAELDTRPQPGVKCPDCGYTNDPQAWYCGVCGADLN
jgi:hypothetical protein